MTSASDGLDRAARFAWGVLVLNLAVIVWGAVVRATGSGAGCGSHWPLCNGTVIPLAPRIETIVELTHRATSGFALVAVFVLVWLTFQHRPDGHPARRVAVASAVLIVIEALLGAGLVLFGWVDKDASWGRVWILGLHLANTFLLLAALSLTAYRLSGAPGNSWRGQGRDGTRVWTMLALIMLVAVTGAITSLGDTLFPAASLAAGLQRDFASTSHFLERLRVVHPALAIVTAFVTTIGAIALARRRRSPATASLSRLARGMILVQVLGGVLNLVLLAPVWMQLVHLLLADLTWISFVLLGSAALAAKPWGGAT